MGFDLNTAIITGRVVKDPQLFGSASNVLRVTVANSKGLTKDGKDNVNFITVLVFGKNAARLSEIVKKGDKVYVEGTVTQTAKKNDKGEWMNNFGVQTFWITVIANAKSHQSTEQDQTAIPDQTDDGFYDNTNFNIPDPTSF